MKRILLSLLFASSFVLLLVFSVRASFVRGVFDNRALTDDVWFQVTLLDAYLGFITVYIWIAWKERTLLRQSLWFVLVMAFGNMAISGYLLWQLLKLPRGRGVSDVLTVRNEPVTFGDSSVHRGES